MRARPRPSALASSLPPHWTPSPLLRPSPTFPPSLSGSRTPPSSSSRRTAWTSALASLRPPRPSHLLAGVPILDPIALLSSELGALRKNVQGLLGSGHPALDSIAKYYFQGEGGKHVRPLIVLLMSQATNGLSPSWSRLQDEAEARERTSSSSQAATGGIDDPLEPAEILNDSNPSLFPSARAFLASLAPSNSPSASSASSSHLLLPTQRRLAEITEMIHVASLLHDDVIDLAETRRSRPSAPSLFGNKLSILAGDFLLARASLALSRLGSNEVVELVASVLANLVEGEVMQMKGNTPDGQRSGGAMTPEIFDHYMRKTYLKTASLIAKSTRATTILGGCGVRQGWAQGEVVKDVAYAYGRNLVDDMLDFTASAEQLGKPGQGADLKLGLATAPALYAWEEFPELGPMIERKFAHEDDVERARYLIGKSSGAERTAKLAEEHSLLARKALEGLPESDARTALDELARDTLKRTK